MNEVMNPDPVSRHQNLRGTKCYKLPSQSALHLKTKKRLLPSQLWQETDRTLAKRLRANGNLLAPLQRQRLERRIQRAAAVVAIGNQFR